jgi:hypothetical protein
MSSSRSLSGQWAFEVDPNGTLTPDTVAFTREIPVPMPWQAVFPDLRDYSGYAWYRRTLEAPADWFGDDILLTFGAVDYLCEVFVNRTLAGAHEGGYTPFSLSVGHLLQPGDNELLVRVYDPAQTALASQRDPGFPIEPSHLQPPGPQSVPHGKQEWYVNVGGIWQDVTLSRVPVTRIGAVRIVTALDGTVLAEIRREGPDSSVAVQADVVRDGNVLASTSAPFADGVVQLELRVESPEWWTPEHPALYTLLVTAGADERAIRFGFRTIATRDGRLLLNGEPLYLVGALDQDFYRETIYTVPSEAFLRDQFRKAKELGLNCLRCHIKVPDPRYLDLADELGLLVWAEIPSWRTFYPKGTVHAGQPDLDAGVRQRVEQTLREMIARDCNHPSLIIWTLVNEDWGTMLPLSPHDRAWVRSLYALCKQLDPTRLAVDNSPCPTPFGPNLHVESDLDDWHTYSNIPDAASEFVRMVEQLNMRPVWTYSSHGDAVRRGDEPVIVSEFGNWGLASVAPYLDSEGREPDWFNLGPWWSGWDGEPGWMKNVLGRYQRLGLASVFGDYDAFARATQWHQYQAMKFEIEAMRRQPTIMGYVITEFTDCYWECNGLLDFDRRPKAYHDQLRAFNTEDVLAPELRRPALVDGQMMELRVHGAHYSAQEWAGAELKARFGPQQFTLPVETVARGEVRPVAKLDAPTNSVARAEVQTLDLQLTGRDGQVLASNTASVLVLPRSAMQPAYTEPVFVAGRLDAWGEHPSWFERAVQGVGYQTSPTLDQARLAITTDPTPTMLEWVKAGGDLLFLCHGPSPFFWAQGRGGAYGGNWLTCWSWIRPEVHGRLNHPELNPLKLPFAQIMPYSTITGLPVDSPDMQADFLAGQISGWVNHPAVHTVQFRFGAGRVVMTTFNLASAVGLDPVGTAMLHDLVEWLASPRCNPALRSNRG